MSKAIQLVQRVKYEKEFAKWSHVGIVAGYSGELVESLMLKGVIQTSLDDYLDDEYVYISTDATDKARIQEYLLSSVGERYGWLNCVSILLTMFIDSVWLTFGGPKACSSLAAAVLELEQPKRMRPANFAERFLCQNVKSTNF